MDQYSIKHFEFTVKQICILRTLKFMKRRNVLWQHISTSECSKKCNITKKDYKSNRYQQHQQVKSMVSFKYFLIFGITSRKETSSAINNSKNKKNLLLLKMNSNHQHLSKELKQLHHEILLHLCLNAKLPNQDWFSKAMKSPTTLTSTRSMLLYLKSLKTVTFFLRQQLTQGSKN